MQTRGGGGQKIRKFCRRHMYMSPYMASMRAGTRRGPQFLTPLKEEFCTPHSRNKELPPLLSDMHSLLY